MIPEAELYGHDQSEEVKAVRTLERLLPRLREQFSGLDPQMWKV